MQIGSSLYNMLEQSLISVVLLRKVYKLRADGSVFSSSVVGKFDSIRSLFKKLQEIGSHYSTAIFQSHRRVSLL